MNKVFKFIIKKRFFILPFFLLLAIGSVFLLKYVTINYDISSYLSKDSSTRKTVEVMDSEFGNKGSFQLMVENVDSEKALSIKTKVEEVEGVKIVVFDIDDLDYYHDNYALYNILLENSNFDASTRKAVNDIKEILKDEKIYLTGGAVESLFLGDSVNQDMYAILLIAIAIVFVILIINSVSWIEPVIFMIVIGVAIIINLGTNACLPSISFVTSSICAVMQLALAMDYSIMLLHKFISERENNQALTSEEAAISALNKSIMPILSSGLTTIAGLIALVFMNFKIGFDIGIVLSKGIIISLIVVLFFMPGLLVIFSKLIIKTKHRNLYQIIRERFPSFENKIARYQYKSRFVACVVLVVLIVVGFVFYLQADYKYTLDASNDPNSVINLDKDKIEKEFGVQNNVIVLLPKEEENKEAEVVEFLENYDYNGSNPFNAILCLTTSGLADTYTADELAERFGLPSQIVESVFQAIDNQDKHKIKEVVDYLNNTTFISDYTNKLQGNINGLYELSLLLDKEVNPEVLAITLSKYGDIEFSQDNANALINKVGNDLTFKEFLIKLIDDKVFINIYNNYASFVETSDELESKKTKEQIKAIFDLSEEDLNNIYQNNESLYLKNVISNLDSTKLKENDIDKYNYYLKVLNKKDVIHNNDYVETSSEFDYNILPSMAYKLAFLVNDNVSNYQIQKSLVVLLKPRINGLDKTLDDVKNMLELVDKEIGAEEISNELGLPQTLVSPIYNELGKEKITGIALLTYVKEHDYINKVGESLKQKIIEAGNTISYAYETFESDNYTRIVMNIKYKRSSSDAVIIARNLETDLNDYYDHYYVASECGVFGEFEDTFSGDSIKISVASLFFILIIIAISFRSLSIPIILTLTIQGAIWFTMAFNVWIGNDVYFICYLMIVCIQMGTTIDYGILYTSKYLEERKQSDHKTSLKVAFHGSITTILTSGTIIVVASFIVGLVSRVSIISSIGYLLSIGTIVSLLFILFALPQVLVVSEHFIELTTIGYKNKK